MRKFIPLFCGAAALVMAGTGCSKDKTAAEANAEKVEAFKKQQTAKAAKAYQEIVATYPDSPFASQAKQRLDAIGPIATPAPKK